MLQAKRPPRLNRYEREAMRRACRFNAELMDAVREIIRPGITTADIDRFVHEYTVRHGHIPATLGYQGFPRSCCTSPNEVICHGIPSDDVVLKEGDIVNVDLTTIVDGWHGDQSETFVIGEASASTRALVQCAFECLHAAIDAVHPNCRVSVIGEAITALARERGFSVVQEYIGHGLGRHFHQEPSIPHVPNATAHRQRLAPGVCFTIEPMINAGSRFTELDRQDGWTVRTKDRTLSAQFEHTILMTESGPEVLTRTRNGPWKGHQF